MSNFLAATVAAAGLILLLGQIGNEDYRTALAEEREACAMVAAGHWPAETAEGYRCPEQVAGANHE
jgi:hypothetical protein